MYFIIYVIERALGKKRFPQANNDVIQRFQKEFAGEEMMLEQKQHFSITVAIIGTSWNSFNLDFFFFCVKNVFGIFSVFPRGFLQCDICGTPDHQSVTS